MLSNDMYSLEEFFKQYEQFDSLIFDYDKQIIMYEDRKIELKGFDIEKFMMDNSNLVNNPPADMEDAFNIVKLHADYYRLKNNIRDNKEDEEEAKKQMEQLIVNNPSLSNFHVFKNTDSYDYEKSFLKYQDKSGRVIVLEDVTARDFMEIYYNIRVDGRELTEEELFQAFASRFPEVKLENRFDAERRIGASEEHINNLRNLEQKNEQHLENHNIVLGNEDYGIYINNGKVITMGYNKSGRKIVENHRNDGIENNEEDLKKDQICNYDEQQLISFEEYKDIIVNSEYLNDEERVKVINFENFLFGLFVYKDYLTPELYAVYQEFGKMWEYLETINDTTMVIEDAKYRYRDILERSEKRSATVSRNYGETRKLINQWDSRSSYNGKAKMPKSSNGYVNALLYVGVTIFVGVVVAVITVLAK